MVLVFGNKGLENYAKYLATRFTYSHSRPNGDAWYTVNSSIMYGENLAKLYNSGDSVVAAWMASPTHAANIMESGFKSVGIAVFQAENGNWYWAQEFGY